MFYWVFDFELLKENYNISDFSIPIRKAMFKSLKQITLSKSTRINHRKFTIWMGDSGLEYQYFCLGIRSWIYARVQNILNRNFMAIHGFQFVDIGRTPYPPLIPFYRYENGIVIEYTSDDDLISRKKFDKFDDYGIGVKEKYRKWESAENLGTKQRYLNNK